MNRGEEPFQVDRYGEFLGKIPPTILERHPADTNEGFWRQVCDNAKGQTIIGWSLTNEGLPYPIIKELRFSVHGKF